MHQLGRDILIFELGGRRYGLSAASVRELVRAVAIVSLPAGPPAVEGVFDFRGSVVPVLDIRLRLGLSPKPIELGDHLIIGEVRGRVIAIRVDRALELVVYDGPSAASESHSVAGSGHEERIAKLEVGLAPILDLSQLFSETEAKSLGAYLPKSWADSEGPR